MIVQNQFYEKLPGSCCFQLSKTTTGAAWCSSQAATAAESAACTGTFDMKTIRHWLMGKSDISWNSKSKEDFVKPFVKQALVFLIKILNEILVLQKMNEIINNEVLQKTFIIQE